MAIRRVWYTKPFTWDNIEDVNEVIGVYFLYNSQGSLTYIGKSNNLWRRLQEHKAGGLIPNIHFFKAWQLSSQIEADRIEQREIQRHQPYWNDHYTD